jgi:hypothetical protein
MATIKSDNQAAARPVRKQRPSDGNPLKAVSAWFKRHRNLGLLDRLLRLLAAEVLALAAYFWLGGWAAWLAGAAAVVLLVTAVTGYCSLYVPFRISTVRGAASRSSWFWLAPLLLIIALLPYFGGRYSAQVTSQRFLNDFASMDLQMIKAINGLAINNRLRAVQGIQAWRSSFQAFAERYGDYRPHLIKGDRQFGADLAATRQVGAVVESLAYAGELSSAGGKLVALRNRWVAALNRSGVDTSQVSLFSLGAAIDWLNEAAANKDAPTILIFYPLTTQLIADLESAYSEASVDAVQQALDDLMEAARQGEADQFVPLAKALQQKYFLLEPASR